jgi:hypothetical protein
MIVLYSYSNFDSELYENRKKNGFTFGIGIGIVCIGFAILQ